MTKKKQIFCTPIEGLKLRQKHSTEELAWAEEMASFYGARPIKENVDNFYAFIADVFHAGQISGVRRERARKVYGKTN